ncbi:hypothetical protein VTL71DRAFT_47 [Oculimacula yallundae]|uniref:TM2 domain-containing protein n=1 Tax=Oculimacula yallundae TaxID=86028 RepID=A0ABR4CZ32_9HELO
MPNLAQLRSFIRNHAIHILIYQLSMFTLLFLILSFQSSPQSKSEYLPTISSLFSLSSPATLHPLHSATPFAQLNSPTDLNSDSLHLSTLTRRKWGTCPPTPHCNGKFKTATLLSLFLGTFGVDQFYAHHFHHRDHFPMFALLISFSSCLSYPHLSSQYWIGMKSAFLVTRPIWSMLMRAVAGALAVFKLLTLGGLGTWSLIDVVLWIVGGIYGLPGCGGGYGG